MKKHDHFMTVTTFDAGSPLDPGIVDSHSLPSSSSIALENDRLCSGIRSGCVKVGKRVFKHNSSLGFHINACVDSTYLRMVSESQITQRCLLGRVMAT